MFLTFSFMLTALSLIETSERITKCYVTNINKVNVDYVQKSRYRLYKINIISSIPGGLLTCKFSRSCIRATVLIIVFVVRQSLRFLVKLGVEGLFPIVTPPTFKMKTSWFSNKYKREHGNLWKTCN